MTREEYKDELIAGVVNYALTVKQAINAAYKHADETNPNGWRPASELPPVNENLISELVLCWCVDSTFGTLEPKLGRVWRGEWCFKGVKWWCYPPKEE